MSNTGVISMGVKAPIIRQGDDLRDIVINSVANALYENGMKIQDGDVIGITESVVARAQGNYVTIDDIVQFLEEHSCEKDSIIGFEKNLVLYNPIMSRNRFSMILKAFARYANKITIVTEGEVDEVGNPNDKPNPFTGVDVMDYYRSICEAEGAKFESCKTNDPVEIVEPETNIDCMCHAEKSTDLGWFWNLSKIMNEPVKRADGTMSGYNTDWGLLGSNKANEETLKLFPRKDEAQKLVDNISDYYWNAYGKTVNVLVYGDGCFKSPETNGVSIWEFADPVTCPAFTKGIDGTPNEIKLKAFADDKFKDLNGEELEEAVKDEISMHRHENLVGNMTSQGTTPRQVTDLLASLCDLTSGSGDKGTPVILIKNYFKKYCD